MSKRRVVITGAGIVSCIGNDLAAVEASLRQGRSASRRRPSSPSWACAARWPAPEIDLEARIDRKQLRFMGDAAAYAQIALEDAIQQAAWRPSR
jgi:3-oxoacyl-[acyl-carrier-protein] synthase-1